jgi:hypothetical protein
MPIVDTQSGVVLAVSMTLEVVHTLPYQKRKGKGEINMKKSLRFLSLGVLLALVLTMGLSAQPAFCTGGDCPPCDNPGVRSPGYWMNHPEAWPESLDPIQIGNDWFTKEEAIAIMQAPVAGDKTFTMFPALVAARLDVRIGNCDCVDGDGNRVCIYPLIGEAQDWFDSYPLGSGVEASSEAWQYSHGENIYDRLDAFINGEPYYDENGFLVFQCAPEADE